MKQNNDGCGTSFHVSEIVTTVNKLKKVLGEPYYEENTGEEKVNFDWRMEHDGIVFTIYEFYGLNRVRITDTNEVKKIIGSFEFNELLYEIQFDIYTDIISEFWNNPLLIDQDYMYVTPDVSIHLYGER